jgi:outer membrane protein assembly factor BamB
MKVELFYTQNNKNANAVTKRSQCGHFGTFLNFGIQDTSAYDHIFNIGKYLLLVILITVSTFTGFAQVEVKWTKELPADILWQEVTALGNLIVSSNNQLVGIDTETGEIRWSKHEHAGLYREAFNELPNSPFFTVTTNNSIHLIDQLTGDEVFDSYKAGINTIEDYFLLYNSDAILVAGKGVGGEPLMVSVKMSEGSLSWTMKEKFGRIIAATELGNNELLIVTLFNNYKLNASTGTIIWKEANSAEAEQADKLGALGDLIKAAAETLTKDMEIDIRYYKPAGSDVFYLGSQQESQSSMTSSSGEPIVNYTNVYNAFNINDGSLVWNDALEVKGKLGQVAFLDDGILVLPNDGNRTKINLYDYKMHAGIWGKKGRGIAIKGGIYDYLDAGDGILLVSQTTNKNYLNYLDPNTGTITFVKPVKVEGMVIGIVPLSSGILYITTESMNILDQASGTLKWSKSIKTTPQLTAEYDGKIYAFDSKSRTLKVVDMNNETANELSTTQLKFEGKEIPRNLEIMDDGIFIHSDQNVAKFNFDGLLLFQEYYPAPHEPGWKRALLYAEAVRGAYIGASSYYMSGTMAAVENEVRQEDAIAGEIVSQIGDAYGELGAQASSYASSAFKQANARKKATFSTREFMLIMSKQDKTLQLLKVSKSNGQVEGSIDLGKDLEPVYAVDDVTGQVYYCTGNRELTSYIVK